MAFAGGGKADLVAHRLRMGRRQRGQHRRMGLRGQQRIPQRDHAHIPRTVPFGDMAGQVCIILFDLKARVNQHHPPSRGRGDQGKGGLKPAAVVAFRIKGRHRQIEGGVFARMEFGQMNAV